MASYKILCKKYEQWITEPAKLLNMELAMSRAGRIEQADKIHNTRLAIRNTLMAHTPKSAFRKISLTG